MALSFSEYLTLRNRAIAYGSDEARSFAKSMTSAEYRSELLRRAVVQYGKAATAEQRLAVLNDRSPAAAEADWVSANRPYWQVFPVAVELSQTVRLDLPFRSITHPFKTVLIRFAKGRELAGVLATALIHCEQTLPDGSAYLRVQCQFASGPAARTRATLQFRYRPDDLVEAWIERLTAERQSDPRRDMANQDPAIAPGLESLDRISESLVRLVVFIGLLAKGDDLITPIVLAKDRAKWESTSDPNVRDWLERRAARVNGRGFNVCERLEAEREISPHWRNFCMALYWTGAGRTIPIIRLRAGSVILRSKMSEVPTDYFGPELPSEDVLPSGDESPIAPPIPAGQRFRILKRDGYRCQLCGRSPRDAGGESVKLHVDHKLARVAGGANDDANLWTLCQDCNLGKGNQLS